MSVFDEIFDDFLGVVPGKGGIVGDALGDIFSWIDDEIIQPIYEFQAELFNNLAQDIPYAMALAMIAVTGAWGALPYVQAAKVKSDGGSWGDAVVEGIKVYVTQQIAGAFGDVAGSVAGISAGALEAAGISAELASSIGTLIGDFTAAGASTGTVELITGGSFSDGFSQGALMYGAQFVTGKIMGEVEKATGLDFKSPVYETDPNTGEYIFETDPSTGNTSLKPKVDTNGKIIEEYKKLPDVAQTLIREAVFAELAGKELSTEYIATALAKATITQEVLGNTLEKIPGVDFDSEDGELFLSFLTPAIQTTVGDIAEMGLGKEAGTAAYNNLQNALSSYSSAVGFSDIMEKIEALDLPEKTFAKIDSMRGVLDDLSAKSDVLRGVQEELNENISASNEIIGEQNSLNDLYQEALDSFQLDPSGQLYVSLQNQYNNSLEQVEVLDDSGNPTGEFKTQPKEGVEGDLARAGYSSIDDMYADAIAQTPTYVDENGVVQSYQSVAQISFGRKAIVAAEVAYEDFLAATTDVMAGYAAEITRLRNSYTTANDDMLATQELLVSDVNDLDEEFAVVTDISRELLVKSINPSFSIEEYITINNLNVPAEEAFNHYVEEGAKQNLVVSNAQRDALKDNLAAELKTQAAAQLGVSINSITDAQMVQLDDIVQQTMLNFNGADGNFDISKAIATTTDAETGELIRSATTLLDNSLSGISIHMNARNGEGWVEAANQRAKLDVILGDGVTWADVVTNNAVLGYDQTTGRETWLPMIEAGGNVVDWFNASTGMTESIGAGLSLENVGKYDSRTWWEKTPEAWDNLIQDAKDDFSRVGGTVKTFVDSLSDSQIATLAITAYDILDPTNIEAFEDFAQDVYDFSEVSGNYIGANGSYAIIETIDAAVTSFDNALLNLSPSETERRRQTLDSLIKNGESLIKWGARKMDAWMGTQQFEGTEDDFENALKTTAAVSVQGLAELTQSFLGLGRMVAENPMDSPVYQFAEKLIVNTESWKSDEWRANAASMNDLLSNRAVDDPNTPIDESLWGTADIISGAAGQYPMQFLGELIFREGIQEVVPLIVGGGVGFAVGKAGARALGEEAARRAGMKSGLTGAMLTDTAESAGGTAQGTYEEALQVVTQTLEQRRSDNPQINWTDNQIGVIADRYAQDMALKSGVFAGITTLASMKFGGQALDLSWLGVPEKKLTSWASSMAVAGREAGAEAVEEGLIQGHLEGMLSEWDPTRNVSGNVYFSAAIGGVIAGPVTFAMDLISPSRDYSADPSLDNEDGSAFEMPTFEEASGQRPFISTGDVTADFLLLTSPDLASNVYSGAGNLTTVLGDTGISLTTIDALQGAANDPNYLGAWGTIPSELDAINSNTTFKRTVRPDTSAFPPATAENKFYFDPITDSTFKFVNGAWEKSGNGNNTVGSITNVADTESWGVGENQRTFFVDPATGRTHVLARGVGEEKYESTFGDYEVLPNPQAELLSWVDDAPSISSIINSIEADPNFSTGAWSDDEGNTYPLNLQPALDGTDPFKADNFFMRDLARIATGYSFDQSQAVYEEYDYGGDYVGTQYSFPNARPLNDVRAEDPSVTGNTLKGMMDSLNYVQNFMRPFLDIIQDFNDNPPGGVVTPGDINRIKMYQNASAVLAYQLNPAFNALFEAYYPVIQRERKRYGLSDAGDVYDPNFLDGSVPVSFGYDESDYKDVTADIGLTETNSGGEINGDDLFGYLHPNGVVGDGAGNFYDDVVWPEKPADYDTNLAAKDEYDSKLLQYYFVKSIDNGGWSAEDAANYVYTNGQDIVSNMVGMDETAFNNYYVTNANSAQTFAGIDPSPRFTARTFKKFALDRYNFTEDDYYKSLESLGTTREAIDASMELYFNDNEIKKLSPEVQAYVENNYVGEDKVVAAYKSELGQSYEPSDEEIAKYIGATFNQSDSVENLIDQEFFISSEQDDLISTALGRDLTKAPDVNEGVLLSLIDPTKSEAENTATVNNYINRRIAAYESPSETNAKTLDRYETEGILIYNLGIPNVIPNPDGEGNIRNPELDRLIDTYFADAGLLGVDDTVSANDRLQQGYEAAKEAHDAARVTFMEDNYGITPTPEQLERLRSATDTQWINDDEILQARRDLAAANNEKTLSPQELGRYLSDLGLSYNSDDGIYQAIMGMGFTGEGGATFDADQRAAIAAEVTRLRAAYDAEQAAEAAAAELETKRNAVKATFATTDYTPTPAEIDQFLDNTEGVAEFVQGKRDDTKDAFGDYNPSEEEITTYLNNNAGIAGYLEPRQYTRTEAIADLETELGRSLTQEEIDDGVYDSFLDGVVQLDGDINADATGKTQVETDITNADDVRSYLQGLDYDTTGLSNEDLLEFAGTGLGIDLGTATSDYQTANETITQRDARVAAEAELAAKTAEINAAMDDPNQDGGAFSGGAYDGIRDYYLYNPAGKAQYDALNTEDRKALVQRAVDNRRYSESEIVADIKAAFPADADLSVEDLKTKYGTLFTNLQTEGNFGHEDNQRIAFGAATTTEAEARDALEATGFVIPEGFDFTNFTGVMDETQLGTQISTDLSPLQYTRADAEAALAAELGRPLTAEDLTTYESYLDGLVDMTGATEDVIGDAQVQGDITNEQDVRNYLSDYTLGEDFSFDGLTGLDVDLDDALGDFKASNRTTAQNQIAADLGTKGWVDASDDDIAAVESLDSAGRDAWIADRQFTRDQAIAALAVQGIDANHPQFENLITQLEVDKGAAGTPTTQGALVDNPEDDLIDQFITTQAEVDAAFGNYGYFDPTDANIPTGVIDDSTLEGLVGTYVDDNYVSADEARAALDGIAGIDALAVDDNGDYVITDDQLVGMGLTGQYSPADLGNKVDAATTTEEEVVAAFGEDYTPTEDEIARYVGLLPDGDLGTDIPAYVADRMDTLVSDVGDLALTVGQLQDQLNGALADGGSLDQAVSKVADDLNIAEDALLKLIGDNSNKFDDLEAAFGTQATDDQEATGIWANIADLEGDVGDLQDAFGAPATDDEAATGIYGIIDQVAEGVLSNEEALELLEDVIGNPAVADNPLTTDIDESSPATGVYAQSGEGVNADVLEAINAVYDYVGNAGFASSATLDEVAAAVGKPAQEVTQEDIDAVNQMVTDNVGATLGGTELTYDQLYDVNNDGVITVEDANLLAAIQSGDYSTYGGQLSTDSQFANTGFYDIFDQNRYAQEQAAIETERQRQLDLETQAEIDAQIQADMNTQINAQISAQQDAEKRSLLYALAASQPQQTKSVEPYVAPFKQRYNWESIFSSEQEEADREKISPYGGYSPEPEQGTKAAATGGLITDESDELLALLGLE
jgi:hypothetical protein